jgi:Pyruvate/2-oxoacid:ferredoxin oxidoreductase delta subunit
MTKSNLYEQLRILLSTGENVIALPKHVVIEKLLSNMYTEEEAKILTSSFEKVGTPTNLRTISKLSGIPKEELKAILEDMNYKGKLFKLGPLYMLLPYLPGGFEVYFSTNRDDPERIKKVAEAHIELRKLGFSFELSASDYPIFRVVPAIEPTEKLVEVSNSMDVKFQVLPYEILQNVMSNAVPKLYAVVPCSCRTASKLAGKPCNRTDENFCVTTGMLARSIIDQEIGQEVTLDELMEIMEKAEKQGLVHQTFNMQDTSVFVCNCCSCCCGFLRSVKDLNNYGSITKSNFEPEINLENCTLCEACMEICPMEAIYHHWPHNKDLSDDMMLIRRDRCIGCGVCASNCPSEAISLVKTKNIIPLKERTELMSKRSEAKTH